MAHQKYAAGLMSVCILLLMSEFTLASDQEGLTEITVFESSTKTLTQAQALVNADEIYLSTQFLQERFGLERKVLSDDMVGICLQELCIPFSKRSGPHRLRFEAGKEYVPMKHLLTALRGNLLWDDTANELLLDLQAKSSGSNVLAGNEVDFVLPDMTGNRVALSDFKGKKVALFAWASW